jgi:hypothetical protein
MTVAQRGHVAGAVRGIAVEHDHRFPLVRAEPLVAAGRRQTERVGHVLGLVHAEEDLADPADHLDAVAQQRPVARIGHIARSIAHHILVERDDHVRERLHEQVVARNPLAAGSHNVGHRRTGRLGALHKPPEIQVRRGSARVGILRILAPNGDEAAAGLHHHVRKFLPRSQVAGRALLGVGLNRDAVRSRETVVAPRRETDGLIVHVADERNLVDDVEVRVDAALESALEQLPMGAASSDNLGVAARLRQDPHDHARLLIAVPVPVGRPIHRPGQRVERIFQRGSRPIGPDWPPVGIIDWREVDFVVVDPDADTAPRGAIVHIQQIPGVVAVDPRIGDIVAAEDGRRPQILRGVPLGEHHPVGFAAEHARHLLEDPADPAQLVVGRPQTVRVE